MPKYGDTKPCRCCAETSILTHIPESAASFSGSGDLNAKVVPASSAWKCEQCGDLEQFDGTPTD